MQDVAALVERARAPAARLVERHEAFGELVERFQDMAYGYACCLLRDHSLAQDAAQEAFLVAYRGLGQLRQPAAFPGWLKRIVVSQCNRLGRQQPREADGDPQEQAGEGPSIAEVVEARETAELVRAAIRSLPEGERLATVLFYIDGYSQAEVASFLEAPVTAVRKRLERARNRLREVMVEMVRDDLGSERPSRDRRFLQEVQFAALLDAAAQQGELAVFEALLVDGYDPNVQGEGGLTLLHLAVRRRSLDAVAMLVKAGANPNSCDRSGKTPLQEAVRIGAQDIADCLRRHGGR